MKRVFLKIILFLPFICFSQENDIYKPEQLVEPKPYSELLRLMDNYRIKHTNVKSLTKVYKKSNNKIIDTVSKEFFNYNSLLIKKINYENNKSRDSIIYKYNQDSKLNSWEHFKAKERILCSFSYNADGKIEALKKNSYKNNESSITENLERVNQTFKYIDNMLTEVETQNWRNGINSYYLKTEYQYKVEKPITEKNNYKSKSFQYYNNGNLKEIYDYIGEIDEKNLYGVKSFYYDNKNRLIKDSNSYGKDYENNKFQIAKYKYNDGNLLKSINAKFDGHYRNAKFIYDEENKIKEFFVETDLRSTSKLKVWIHPRADYFSYPIKYKEVFEYDSYGNMTLNEKYVNGKLIFVIEYLMTYQ